MTPLELDIALKDRHDYEGIYQKHLMNLLRYVGVVMRNKGLRPVDQMRDAREFYKFFWEVEQSAETEDVDWDQLDKKYANLKHARP